MIIIDVYDSSLRASRCKRAIFTATRNVTYYKFANDHFRFVCDNDTQLYFFFFTQTNLLPLDRPEARTRDPSARFFLARFKREVVGRSRPTDNNEVGIVIFVRQKFETTFRQSR